MTRKAHEVGRQIVQSFEAEALKKRNFAQKVADYLSTSFGTVSFLAINAATFAFWVLANTGYVSQVKPFDPFPFPLLTTAVSLEAIFLSIIVLMSQNRQGFINSLREELHYQIDLISEREITKILKLVSEIHRHHGVKSEEDPELEEMLKQIDASFIERRLAEQLLASSQIPILKEVAKEIIRVPTKFISSFGRNAYKNLSKKSFEQK